MASTTHCRIVLSCNAAAALARFLSSGSISRKYRERFAESAISASLIAYIAIIANIAKAVNIFETQLKAASKEVSEQDSEADSYQQQAADSRRPPPRQFAHFPPQQEPHHRSRESHRADGRAGHGDVNL